MIKPLIKRVTDEVAKELDLPQEVVELAYRYQWKFIRKEIISLDISESISDEEFKKIRTNFNVPSLGKLGITINKLNRVKRRKEYYDKNIKSKSVV